MNENMRETNKYCQKPKQTWNESEKFNVKHESD